MPVLHGQTLFVQVHIYQLEIISAALQEIDECLHEESLATRD